MNRVFFVLVPLILAAGQLAAAITVSRQEFPRRVALVIGNGAYAKVAPLKNPANDAEDLSAALRACGFTVVKAVDCQRTAMDDAIFRFSRLLEKSEVALFFYAGHAVQVDGANYLVPVDAEVTRKYQLGGSCVPLGSVLGALAEAGNGVNIVILDACRDNPFPGVTELQSKGLARVDPPKRSLLVYATAPGSVAADGDGRNGLYTACLLKHIQTLGLEVMDLLRQVTSDVLAASGDKQVPWSLSSLTGRFSFTDGAAEAGAEVLVSGGNAGGGEPARRPAQAAPSGPRAKEAWTVPGLGLELAPVEAGSFEMGSRGNDRDEMPVHAVSIGKAFWLGKYEVTQEEYEKVVGKNPSEVKGKRDPVETVTWKEARVFCERLSATEREAGRLPEGYVYRLPTEAEWEYCCRAGGKEAHAGELDKMAWFKDNAGGKHHPVGKKEPNAWGLFDLHGNVSEWVLDAYRADFYGKEAVADPLCLKGTTRAARGGSWNHRASDCRSANRLDFEADLCGKILGFRVALAPGLAGAE